MENGEKIVFWETVKTSVAVFHRLGMWSGGRALGEPVQWQCVCEGEERVARTL